MHAPIDSSAQPQGVPEPNATGYEKSDMAAKWVFGFFAFLFVGGIVIHLFTAWQLSDLWKKPPPADRWSMAKGSARAPGALAREFPRLQLSPPADLEAFRAREEAELNTYGWVNQTAGVVRIPIDRAMELLLQKGLPVQPTTNKTQAGKSILGLQHERASQARPGVSDGSEKSDTSDQSDQKAAAPAAQGTERGHR